MTFEDLQLIQPILNTLKSKGYTTPTSIQEKAIPYILEGKDIFGLSQTGTGKTAAFALPVLQLLYTKRTQGQRKAIKALVLAPTRELAEQINSSFRDYGKSLHLKHLAIYGGVSQRPQTEALRSGVDILIATPGRLMDLIDQGYVHLQHVEHFILDEVDRMLDMGFIHDIKDVVSILPKQKQTLFFSATLPTEIKKLAAGLLQNPITVATAPSSSTSTNIKQQVYFVAKESKKDLLKYILSNTPGYHILVFTRTKRNADRVAKNLYSLGLKAEAIHGDKSQGARQRALQQFKLRKISLLIATDVASRGLDISDVTHVINYDLPEEAEVYVHRIGRTGRAGAQGCAISFCANDERYLMKAIYKLSGNKIETLQTPVLSNTEISFSPRNEATTHSEEKEKQPVAHTRQNEERRRKPNGKKFFPKKNKWNKRWPNKSRKQHSD